MFRLISRKSFSIGLIGSAGAVGRPAVTNANPAIIAALGVGASVVSIVSGISSFFSAARQQAALESIKSKLDTIIASQAEIISEIKALKLYIDSAILQGFVDKTQNVLIAEKKTFDVLVVDGVSHSNVGDYQDLRRRVEQTVNELGQYGVGAFFSFGCGIALNLLLYRLLSISSSRIVALSQSYIAVLEGWQSPDNANGIVQISARTQAEIDSRITAINSRERQFVIQTDLFYDDATNGRCKIYTYLNINGDFMNGFKYYTSKSGPIECVYLHHNDPCLRGGCEISADIDTTQNLIADPFLGKLAEPKPSVSQSPFQQFNSINDERNSIIEEMNTLNRQKEVAKQIKELIKALQMVK